MEETLQTYALWGKGELAPENAKALLEEYIPDNVGTVFRPATGIDRDHKGLRAALDWFEAPDFLGDGGAVPSEDLIQSLIDERDGEFHDEVYLLALWPAEPTHEDFDFIELAQNSGITVFDLSRALDELDLTLYSRPAPTAEEKAAAKEEVKRGRGRPRKTQAKPPEDDYEGGKMAEQPEEEIPAVEEVVHDAAVPVDDTVSYAPVPVVEPIVPGQEEMAAMLRTSVASMDLVTALDAYISAKVEESIARVLGNLGLTVTTAAKEAAIDSLFEKERPPFDGPYVDVDSKPYLRSVMGTYRPAPPGTKQKRGEIVENLTEARVKELEDEGRITPF